LRRVLKRQSPSKGVDAHDHAAYDKIRKFPQAIADINGVLEVGLKAAIMPGFSELIIIINPAKQVNREGLLNIIMPWLYAPWPGASEKGVIEIEVAGDTLKALLMELSHQYKQANVDFDPIDSRTNDLDFDYDVFVNGKNYVALAGGLDTKLKDGDEVKVKILWRWDG